ncbi:hypothetical protein Nepgr_027343 [Nepenthes gracilis]|uniref:PHD-type domain-containing protein n=1 Tax=Nepenthes gracilis TaxID=150966 RepID=A0AAD3Y2V7_NEPGR|nr:hypothetical protein Nepgr_027343 [Nepenthes gracilis]
MDLGDSELKEVRSTVVGIKRAAEDCEEGQMEDGLEIRGKKMRNGEEEEMRRVAEIVLVLSAMGRMRGGKEPTAAEKAMMTEARAKVVAMCEELAPKDILPREAFGGVIEDLGLNGLKDQRPGFRMPKLSIVDRMHLAIRRMGEPKEFAAKAASYPSQRPQTTGAAAVDNRWITTTAHGFPSDKRDFTPVSSGSVEPPIPVGHVSSTTSAALPFQLHTNKVRPPMSSTSTAPPRVESVQYRSDGRPNGPSFSQRIPVISASEQHAVKPTTSPLQPLSAPLVTLGAKAKPMDHQQIKAEGIANINARQKTTRATNVQTSKPVITQTTPTMLPGMHPSILGMHFVHAAPIFNHHLEISKIVQKLLHSKVPQYPSWTPPSRDYINKALTCQMCKLAINEVEGVLVCDACEKGYHLRCLQSFNQKVIPRGEWHCNRCLSIINGKPFSPKYGRVTRNINASKMPSNPAGIQSSSENEAETADHKVNQHDQTVNQSNVMINDQFDSGNPPQAGPVADTLMDSRLLVRNEMHGSDASLGLKKDDEPSAETSSNDMASAVRMPCASPPGGSSSKAPAQLMLKSESCLCEEGTSSDTPAPLVLKSESCPREDRLIAEAESENLVKPPPVKNASDHLQEASNHKDIDQRGVSRGVEVELKQQNDSNEQCTPLEKSDVSKAIDPNSSHDAKQNGQGFPRENHLATLEVRMEQNPLMASDDGLHNVDWVGDLHKVVDEKEFYQSCSIKGVLYKLQDYALFRLDNGKLIPSKLQAMWQDNRTNSKWVTANRCYFPTDLPELVGHPCALEINEVFESNDGMTLMAGLSSPANGSMTRLEEFSVQSLVESGYGYMYQLTTCLAQIERLQLGNLSRNRLSDEG